VPPGSWTFHHHPILPLHALDQNLVTALCRLVVKVERKEELTATEEMWMRCIHREIREGPDARNARTW
jgi:hypothetical protein